MADAFYLSATDGSFDSQYATSSAWGPGVQHGGPPAALLARAIEASPAAEGRLIGRITVDLLGPVPVAPLTVTTSVQRSGRSVGLVEAVLTAERPVAKASAWLFPAAEAKAADDPAGPRHGPGDGAHRSFPDTWSGGYLDATEWRWVSGEVHEGRATAWMRPRVALVDDEPWSPVPRLLATADSASGVSSALDPGEWQFLNTELTVHVLRPPVGEWLCLDAETTLASGSVGLATSSVYDEQGLVARTAQALLVARRTAQEGQNSRSVGSSSPRRAS